MPITPSVERRLLVGAMIIILLLNLMPAHDVQARAVFHVTTWPEMRAAINSANGNGVADTIYIDVSLTPPSTATALPAITSEITITSDSGCSGGRCGISGGSRLSIFEVTPGGNLTLDNVVLANGYGQFISGAVENSGTLTVRNCAVYGNTSSTNGGAISNSGNLTIEDSTFYGNSITGEYAGATGSGGAVYSSGTLTITRSEFKDNSVNRGVSTSNIFHGGAIAVDSGGTLTITDSMIRRNSSDYNGGGISLGALAAVNAASITNITISENAAGSGGGIYVGIANSPVTIDHCHLEHNSAISGGALATFTGSTTNLRHSTITDNTATSNGSAVYCVVCNITGSSLVGNQGSSTIYAVSLTTVTLSGVIVGDTTGGVNCDGFNPGLEITDSRYNVSDDDSCAFGNVGSLNNATLALNPQLAPIWDPSDPYNGYYYDFYPASDAIGVIPQGTTVGSGANAWTCSNPSTQDDQVGTARPQPAGTRCDAGAIESIYQRYPITVTKTGTGGGTVVSNPAGINCGSGANCSADFMGDYTDLTATPDATSTFVGWTGCDEILTNGDCRVYATNAGAITAEFAIAEYTLTVDKAGTGSGTVTGSDPTEISCGADCDQLYTVGTTVTLTATADNENTFVGWTSGCDSTSGNTCTVTLASNTTVQAQFEPTSISVGTTSTTDFTEGGSTSFDVVLSHQPSNDVNVALTNTTPGACGLSSTSLQFTSADWDTPQTVTLTDADDAIDNGDSTCTITLADATSTGADFNGVTPSPNSVSVTVFDDDTAGITANPIALSINEGSSDTFDVVLDTEPTGDVVIDMVPNSAECTVSPASLLTFSSGDWDSLQTVTVSVQDNAVADGNRSCTVALTINTTSTTATEYGTLDPADVTVSIGDNETASVLVAPTIQAITEGDPAVLSSVSLTSEPSGTVQIDISTGLECTASVASMTFNAGNWTASQPLNLSVTDDQIANGARTCAVTLTMNVANTTAGEYQPIDPNDITLTITDDDTVGVTVNPTAITVTEGDADTFDVVLNTQPTANSVVIDVVASPAECSPDLTQLTFTTTDWNTAQPITVSVVENDIEDGDRACTIQLTMNSATAAAEYQSIDPTDVAVSITDNDSAGVIVDPTAIAITEGGAGQFTVSLNTQPTADSVIIDLASSSAECVPDATQLIFTTADWNAPQPVIVNTLDNSAVGSEQFCAIILTMNAATADATYQAIDPADVQVTISDDEYHATAEDHARAQAPLCADLDGSTNPIIRAEVPGGTVMDGSVFCRVLAQDGVFTTTTGEVGDLAVLQRGVIQAVDVFGLRHNGLADPYFNAPVAICLQGSGAFMYMDATAAPRSSTELPVFVQNGYTCATVPNAGTVVLVSGAASATMDAPVNTGPTTVLNNCMVTTRDILNLREQPNGDILRMIPYDVTLTALERTSGWFYVDYNGERGWISASYATPQGVCGQ